LGTLFRSNASTLDIENKFDRGLMALVYLSLRSFNVKVLNLDANSGISTGINGIVDNSSKIQIRSDGNYGAEVIPTQ
jgi:GT2 family glycosyltransferase